MADDNSPQAGKFITSGVIAGLITGAVAAGVTGGLVWWSEHQAAANVTQQLEQCRQTNAQHAERQRTLTYQLKVLHARVALARSRSAVADENLGLARAHLGDARQRLASLGTEEADEVVAAFDAIQLGVKRSLDEQQAQLEQLAVEIDQLLDES